MQTEVEFSIPGPSRGADIDVEAAQVDLLRKNAMSTLSVIYASAAGAAPIAAMMFNVPVMAGQAGAATPLAFVLSGAAVVLLGFAIVWYARRFSAAGGFYNYVAHGLGQYAAFQAGWLMLAGYAITVPAEMAAFGAFTAESLQHYFGIRVSWLLLAFIGTALLFLVSYRDISWSIYAMAPFLIIEVLSLILLDIAIFARGGAAGHALVPAFTALGASVKGVSPGGWAGIGLAMVLGIQTWIGFEGGAVYGEEARHPKKAIPLAVLGVAISLVFLYTWTSYAAVIGFGWQNAASVLAAHPADAFFMLADRYLPLLHPIMAVAIATSGWACGLAFHNGMVRYFYAMGREGILPRWFGRTHPKFKSPVSAIIVQSCFTALVLLVFGGLVSNTGTDLYAQLATIGAICLIVVYIIVCVGASVLFPRESPTGYRAVTFVVPLAGALIMLYPLSSFVHPMPPFPFSLFPYLVLAWILVGVALTVQIARRYPDRFEIMGRVMRLKD